ncbi:polyferredoxin [Desulfohalotomaculum tongense]|uniref:4Fe-4S binding protein n=1 Tax=Desulforadius tongensis TaxID=1216062 RepID=UPI0019593268|nr:4Fe-4S binding protein [Desulforadius tongensis]MBM7854099.1 polyferredoxin [Desulforadius tongensis]
MHVFGQKFIPVSIDSLCPFGAIESAYILFTEGTMLKRIAWSNFILLFAVLLVALIFKRAFCGMICPLGFLQELSYKLRVKFSRRRYTIPNTVDKILRYVKYLLLAAVIIFTYQSGEMVWRSYDPWIAYHHLFSKDLWDEFSIGLGLLVITLVGSFFYNRVFCKYICPMAAFLALLSPFGLTSIKRNESTCINCKKCNNVCPVNIDVQSNNNVTSVECINCNECVNVCPVKDTLYISGKKSFKISERRVLETVVAIFVLVIGITTFTGDFNWQKPSLAVLTESKGSFNSSLISGKDTLNDIIGITGIPAKIFIDKYNIKEKHFNLPLKEAGQIYGFKTQDIRDLVDKYNE